MDLEQALNKVNLILDKHGLEFEVYRDNFEVYDMQEAADDCKEIEIVYSEGDWEGGGEHAEKVFKITPEGETPFYIRCAGEYSSWSGTEWDSPQLVEPYEVVVTKYRGVK